MIERTVFTLPVKFIPNNSNPVIIIETIGPVIYVGISGMRTLRYPAKPRFTAPAANEKDKKYKT